MRRKRTFRLRTALMLVLVAVFLFAALMLVRALSGKDDALKGVWTLDSSTEYEFDGRGRGVLRLPLGEHAFRYAINGEALDIDMLEESAADTWYRFAVTGDTLLLDNNAGTVYRLTR